MDCSSLLSPVHTSAGLTRCFDPATRGSTHSRHPSGLGSRYILTPRTSAHPTNSALAPGESKFLRSGNPSCKVPLTSTSTRLLRADTRLYVLHAASAPAPTAAAANTAVVEFEDIVRVREEVAANAR
jgi:hypothetical protein